jgi:hypothetical protein
MILHDDHAQTANVALDNRRQRGALDNDLRRV